MDSPRHENSEGKLSRGSQRASLIGDSRGSILDLIAANGMHNSKFVDSKSSSSVDTKPSDDSCTSPSASASFLAPVSLLIELCKVAWIEFFLHTIFLNWPSFGSDHSYSPLQRNLTRICYVVVLGLILLCQFTSLFLSIDVTVTGPPMSAELKAFYYLLFISVIFQLITMLYAIYLGSVRLASRDWIPPQIPFYRQGALLCLKIEVVFLFIVVLAVALNLEELGTDGAWLVLIYIGLEWGGAVSVATVMLFAVADTRIICALLDEVLVEVQTGNFNIQHLGRLREAIETRVAASFFPNTLMSALASFQAIVFLYFIVTTLPQYHSYTFSTDIIFSVAILLKEVFYLVIVTYEVAKVNELALQLSKVLGRSRGECEVFHVDQPELCRLRMFASITADPISFSLLGLKPTRWSLYAQVIGYVGVLVIGLIRSLVLAHL